MVRTFLSLVAVVAALTVTSLAHADPGPVSLEAYTLPDGFRPSSLTNSGLFVGNVGNWNPISLGTTSRAYVFDSDSETLTELAPLGSTQRIYAYGVSNTGHVVGGSFVDGEVVGFISDPNNPGATNNLNIPSWFGFAQAISSNGQYVTGQMVGDGGTTRAYLWDSTNGVQELVPSSEQSVGLGVNDSATVVGQLGTSAATISSPYAEWTLVPDLPNNATVYGINNATDVVGSYGAGANNSEYAQAFALVDNLLIDIPTLNLNNRGGTAYAISNMDQIVGSSRINDLGLETHGFLYDVATETLTDLNSLLGENPEFIVTEALAINDLGQIVATIIPNPNYDPNPEEPEELGGEEFMSLAAFMISSESPNIALLSFTPVPEPTGLAITTIGAVSLYGWRRRGLKQRRG